MCEIVLRVVDKINYENPGDDAKCTKRGDVLAVCPDNWPWSYEEQKNPEWRIIKLPNITEEEASAMLGAEMPSGIEISRMLQRRAMKLDLDNAAIPINIKNFLADHTRATPSITFNVNTISWRALRIVKDPLPDPGIIGADPNIIG